MDSVLKEVTALWRFEHISSSPLYSQCNGEVERAVQTMYEAWQSQNLILYTAPCLSSVFVLDISKKSS